MLKLVCSLLSEGQHAGMSATLLVQPPCADISCDGASAPRASREWGSTPYYINVNTYSSLWVYVGPDQPTMMSGHAMTCRPEAWIHGQKLLRRYPFHVFACYAASGQPHSPTGLEFVAEGGAGSERVRGSHPSYMKVLRAVSVKPTWRTGPQSVVSPAFVHDVVYNEALEQKHWTQHKH